MVLGIAGPLCAQQSAPCVTHIFCQPHQEANLPTSRQVAKSAYPGKMKARQNCQPQLT
jgi:hypothetical protein